jgi:pyruvate dehydrogenase E2 component (dihydrolipoamide acetyltransferase)
MPYELKMPDLTTNDSPIRIIRWIIRPGDLVERGQSLMEVETDKATLEVESAVSGRLERCLAAEGEEVAVGQAIALFESDESSSASAPVPVAPPRPSETTASAASAPAQRPTASGSGAGMFARNREVRAAQQTPRQALPLGAAQRTAARRLQQSKQTIPHFYLQTSFDATKMAARRAAASPPGIAWDAFLVQAVAKALRKFDRFCCRFVEEQLVPANTDAIGVAVDVNDELFVIPVAAPGGKSVEQVSLEIRAAAERLRQGDQELRRIASTLITVTNLGGHNVEAFVPIINPPEPAILGVGKISLVPVTLPDGGLVSQLRGMLTLCVDHRVANGRYAARFLETVVIHLEEL